MKKKLALLMSLAIVAGSLAACGKSDDSSNAGTTAPSNNSSSEVDTTPGVKTGLAVNSSIAKSTEAGDANGNAQVDSTVVAVLVGEDGKILKCVIDAAQTKVEFDKAGKLVTPIDTVYSTKLELGADYGMKGSSSIGKEWNEQAAALAAYVEGKTIDEVKGIALSDDGKATDADLAASVTVSISGYISTIEKAVSNAKVLGATADDTLGLGIVTDIKKSKDAGDEDGLAQAYSTYSVATVGADGKITSSVIDASQSDVKFSKEGKITSDLNGDLQTKGEKGEAYGMKGSSSIGKEWNEQADAFADYAKGKTAEEIKGIALSDEGKATDADLTASVTVTASTFVSTLEKAVATAK